MAQDLTVKQKPQISRNVWPNTWNLALHHLIPNLACPAIITILLSLLLVADHLE